mgnify:CR=1 FL=1
MGKGTLIRLVEVKEGSRSRVFGAMGDGLLSPMAVAEMALGYMSDAAVGDMARRNDIDLAELHGHDKDDVMAVGAYLLTSRANVVWTAMLDGLLDFETVAQMTLKYMSEAEVQDMLRENEISDI